MCIYIRVGKNPSFKEKTPKKTVGYIVKVIMGGFNWFFSEK